MILSKENIYSNDVETNTRGATLPTTNIKIPILVNTDVLIKENPDIPIEKYLNVLIEENSQTNFQMADMSCFNKKNNPRLHSHMFSRVS